MADYGGITSQMQGPVIPVQLYPDAMRAGAEVGNAVKTPLQAAAEGITQGIKNYSNLQTEDLQRQKMQQDIDAAPAKNEADIAEAQARAKYNTAQAQSAQIKAQAEQEDQQLTSNIATSMSQGPEAVNNLLSTPDVWKWSLLHPKEAEGFLDSITNMQGVDQNKSAALLDFYTVQKIKRQEEARAGQLAGDAEKARSTLLSDTSFDEIAQAATAATKQDWTKEQVATHLHTAQAGTKIVDPKTGDLVAKPGYDPTIPSMDPNADKKVDTFLALKQDDGTTKYVPLVQGVDRTRLDKAMAFKGLDQVVSGDTARIRIEAFRRSQLSRMKGNSADLSQGIGKVEATKTAPPPPGPSVPREVTKLDDTSPYAQYSKAKDEVMSIAATLPADEATEKLKTSPAAQLFMAKRLGVTNTAQAAEVAPALAKTLSAMQKDVQESSKPFSVFTRFGTPKDYVEASTNLKKAVAAKDYEAALADPRRAAAVRASTSLDAMDEYNKGRALVKEAEMQGTQGYGTDMGFGSGDYWELLAKYPEDITSEKDLYYIQNKAQFDARIDPVLDDLKRSYRLKGPDAYARLKTVSMADGHEALQMSQNATTPPPAIKTTSAATGAAAENPSPRQSAAPTNALMQATGTATSAPTGVPTNTGTNVETPTQTAGPTQTATPELSGKDVHALISQKAAQYGVPLEIALAVAKVESGGKQSARSSKGAIGVMQLMPATAADLKVNPHDTAQNIDGGIRYLAQLAKRYGGDWNKAVNAYHLGMGNMERGTNIGAESKAYPGKVMQEATRIKSETNA